ncbi:hypothetical protein L3Q82_026496 [Scortum barcoo]|uniref:Uncharacterized protein n=1 Tax=Scortum barcoo TaxID=214431 RepID=A0ACB8WIM7_9TELE|nr:hypothetical protein L3Q82_026496 [Scortum barcoo]
MVNILAADMTEIHGEMYACGIVALFPYLMDPYSKNGYEHFYDRESGSGYLAWRLKIIQRKSVISEGRRSPCQLTSGGPKARREALFSPEVALSEEQCREAMSFMKHSTDEAAIKQKMKLTFEFRCKMVLDGEKSSEVLTEFPRFKDIRGLIEQDFILLFGEEIAAKFLERWPTTFKQKVIQQSKALPTSSDLEELIHCAEAPSYEEEMDDDTLASGWDSDLSSILLLLHLIPPSAQGRKRPGKVSSASQAEKRLVVFKKVLKRLEHFAFCLCNNLKCEMGAISTILIYGFHHSIKSATQPYLLAVGMKRSTVHEFFIVLDKQVIPCKSTTSLAAFDELFKAHFVFGTMYSQMLHNMYTFIQTTVYNIDVGKVQESPRVAEMRARMLH